jgi:hypothetical protein
MSTDPLTGLPVEFDRMLAIENDPYTDSPTKPLDDFFNALMRAQSFRDRYIETSLQPPGAGAETQSTAPIGD